MIDSLVEPLLANAQAHHVGASIGIAFFPEDASDIPTLLAAADTAMYAAKRSGRNEYRFFTPALGETSS